jgi:Protein of unknown function (DUF1552)
MSKSFPRRTLLRGLLNGGAVTVALPLLDCFLNSNATAFADGKPIPVRFGIWSWPLGMNRSVFVPSKIGKDFDFPEEIAALAPVREHINILTNFQQYRDAAPLVGHQTPWIIARTGAPPVNNGPGLETYDITIANQIGRTQRFKTLVATGSGSARTTYSYEDAHTPNPAEYSPIDFYTRLFGPDFSDPNAKDFKPNPRVMARKSTLSAVMDEISWINKRVGAEDKARLDQYFTGLRHLEKQFDQQLTKPEPIAACQPAAPPKGDIGMGNEAASVNIRNQMMSKLLAMAVACDQTRVINMAYCDMSSNTTKPGYDKPHHTCTHEEGIDEKLGYQVNHSWYVRSAMGGLANFIQEFANIKEGGGTLLDNMLVVVDTDHGNARLHALNDLPAFTVGRAGGKIKTGLHIDMKGAPFTQLALTAMRTMGLETQKFGGGTNLTSGEVSGILV